ncbi:MAG: hypothetical protein N5P05_000899 [Chroococcopsis gigantea SAG 12.99]|jgi:filamentous hemagglutinin family protein|nr:CHAT domain-containing protein [Chlorogloea purpurea SAG 13.99]MDV2999293.1 hypothetical protein [Chroococcopsis gigantea SAG 12.99]
MSTNIKKNIFKNCVLVSFLIASSAPLSVKAQIIPDRTLGVESSTVRQIDPNRQDIEGGATRGQNLFHSFQEFNILEGKSAYFTNPAGITNIITRVTGNNPSAILGTLGVSGNANLYLLNPNGIFFGTGARLDISGSFYASTARGLLMPDGSIFSATNPAPPPLLKVTATAPIGLIMSGQTGEVMNLGNLKVGNGQTLLINGRKVTNSGSLTASGGNIQLIGNEVVFFGLADVSGTNSPGGTFLIRADNISIGDDNNKTSLPTVYAGNFLVLPGDTNIVLEANNDITIDDLANNNLIFSPGSGKINLRADADDNGVGSVTMKGAQTVGSDLIDQTDRIFTAGRDINISGQNLILGHINTIFIIDLANFFRLSETFRIKEPALIPLAQAIDNATRTGNINLRAGGDIKVQNLDTYYLSLIKPGNGGNINLSAGNNISTGKIANFSYSRYGGSGDGGNLKISAGNSVLVGSVNSISFGRGDSTGNGGNIKITAGEKQENTISIGTLLTFSLAEIGNVLGFNEAGNGGEIFLRAGGDIKTTEIASSSFSESSSSKDGGNITITSLFGDVETKNITSSSSANFRTETTEPYSDRTPIEYINRKYNSGRGGDINLSGQTITTDNLLSISISENGTSGNGGNITFNGERIFNNSMSSYSTSAKSGTINIQGRENLVIDEIFIVTSQQNVLPLSFEVDNPSPDPGQPRTVRINNNFNIDTTTFSRSGQVIISSPGELTIDNGRITADTKSDNPAGDITLTGRNIVLDNTSINSASADRGDAGNINIEGGGNVTLHGSSITASTSARGKGGNITLTADTLNLDGGSQINTTTSNISNAGTVALNIRKEINLSGNNTGLFANTTASATGNGGDIITDSRTIEFNLENGAKIDSDAQGSGRAGNITLNAGNLVLNDGSISAGSTSGDGGNIALNLSNDLSLFNRSRITTSAGNSQQGGNGGDIQISARTIATLPLDNNDITANAFSGNGGRINIALTGNTKEPLWIQFRPNLTRFNDITASSELGAAGTVIINSPDNAVREDVPTLNTSFVDANSLIAQNICQRGTKSQFVLTGSGGLPPDPLESFTAIVPWQDLNQNRAEIGDHVKSKAEKPQEQMSLAADLNSEGIVQLSRGRSQAALESFQSATAIYRRLGSRIPETGATLNQVYALQALGRNQRAIDLAETLYRTYESLPDSALKADIYRVYGEMSGVMGRIELGDSLLKQSLMIAQNSGAATQIAVAYLSLADRLPPDQALTYYERAGQTPSAELQLQALVERFRLGVARKQYEAAVLLTPGINARLAALPDSRFSVYAAINYAHALNRLSLQTGGRPPAADSVPILARAALSARTLGDGRAEAYALGYLGRLYEERGQWAEAETLTRRALDLSLVLQSPDLEYRWQWQLGRIAVGRGAREKAILAYEDAYKNLQLLRRDLAGAGQNLNFYFRDNVEPLHREWVDLLLQGNPGQDELRRARNIIESLQVAQLDNFFQDGCTGAKSEQIDRIDPDAAIIYPILLKNRLAVITSFGDRSLHYHSIPLTQDNLKTTVKNLFITLNPNIDPRPLIGSTNLLGPHQTIYDWLVRPVETQLQQHKTKTLVFILDKDLQNLPPSVLHDGREYLIQKYNVALTPGLQLLSSYPRGDRNLRGLLAGLARSSQGFAALPGVKQELEAISKWIPSQILLDRDFIRPNLQKQLDINESPIVHLATHGQFSSEADDTFLVAWDGLINVRDLNGWLETRKNNPNPIELLILSACETARGDDRASLGLAGVAVRSGARSTLATLWAVEDRSTSELIVKFYEILSREKLSKAQALREAQLFLLSSPAYKHPYYWAPFVLIGNWQ